MSATKPTKAQLEMYREINRIVSSRMAKDVHKHVSRLESEIRNLSKEVYRAQNAAEHASGVANVALDAHSWFGRFLLGALFGSIATLTVLILAT